MLTRNVQNVHSQHVADLLQQLKEREAQLEASQAAANAQQQANLLTLQATQSALQASDDLVAGLTHEASQKDALLDKLQAFLGVGRDRVLDRAREIRQSLEEARKAQSAHKAAVAQHKRDAATWQAQVGHLEQKYGPDWRKEVAEHLTQIGQLHYCSTQPGSRCSRGVGPGTCTEQRGQGQGASENQ